MADDKQLGALPAAESITGDELMYLVQEGVDRKLTLAQLRSLFALATTLIDGLMSKEDKAKLNGVATGATANATDAYLLDRGHHTGTQDAGTIAGLALVATSGAYGDLIDPPTIPSAAADVGAVDADDVGVTVCDLSGGKVPSSRMPSTDAVSEGSTNQYFTGARVRAVALTGLSTSTATAVAATDTVLTGFGKLQGQISALSPLAGTGNWADVGSKPANVVAIAGLTTAANLATYWTGSGTASTYTLTSFGRSLSGAADDTAARTTLGLGSMATQGAGAVAVTGGTINGTAFGATTAASVRATTLQTTSTAGIGVPSGTTAALNVGGTITSTGTTNYGVLVNNTITSNATSEARVFAAVTNTQAASWTCTTVIGYDAFGVVTLGAGSAITNHYGFRGRATIANAGVTNAYGISLELAAAAGSWNLHASGTAPNYLAGDLRIGTTSQSGSALLTVNGAASFAGPIQLPSYTVATVPAASANARSKIWVSNAAAGAREYVSNGTNWVQSADATTVLS